MRLSQYSNFRCVLTGTPLPRAYSDFYNLFEFLWPENSPISNQTKLLAESEIWLITGVAGFIGSNLLESLLKLNQRVVGLDNFSTGHKYNLDEVKLLVSDQQWANFQFIEGDIRKLDDCRRAMSFAPSLRDGDTDTAIYGMYQVDYVLHQAALGSVPRSTEDPITTNQSNIDGFLNMLVAAKDAKVKRFVYASSSSTYGDHPDLPKVEDKIGNPLSPYAVTKLANELYAQVFAKNYKFETIGLRYFNIFGKRQDPNGAYAAVIPKWIKALIKDKGVFINGDGETSRDFCYIENAIQINLLAATTENSDATDQVYNVAVGSSTTLNELYKTIKEILNMHITSNTMHKASYRDFRVGDVRHSKADITKAQNLLYYHKTHNIRQGLEKTIKWYINNN